MYMHYVGLDLGQARDYTALCVLEESVWVREASLQSLVLDRAGWYAPGDLLPAQVDTAEAWTRRDGRPADPPLSIRHLERLPLGTSYPAVVERVRQVLATPPLRAVTTALVVDETGVGRPVCDLFRMAGVAIVPVTITGGTAISGDPTSGLHVPKRDLVTSAQVLLQNRRLKIASSLPAAAVLVKELEDFKVKISITTGHDTYDAWREGTHDDLVLATCLATWFRSWYCAHLDLAARDWHPTPTAHDSLATARTYTTHNTQRRTT